MIPALVTLAISFFVALVLYPPFIDRLRAIKSGQVIQAELPESHQRKVGTPTGGGILFVALGIVGAALAETSGHSGAAPAMVGLLCGGLIGLADDQSKLNRGSVGIPARFKLPVQFALAAPVAWLALGIEDYGQTWIGGLPYWLTLLIAWIAVVGAGNAVNITDGIDGLAAGLSVIAIGAMVLLLPGAPAGEIAVAMVLCGGLLAFLWFNRYPARVFMGDTGSLALGFALAAMAIQQRLVILLPVIGLVFVLETLSVIIQVAYFKASGGRRVFKMTPIHYTFHLEGWSERRIALSFWTAGLLGALAAFGVARLVS